MQEYCFGPCPVILIAGRQCVLAALLLAGVLVGSAQAQSEGELGYDEAFEKAWEINYELQNRAYSERENGTYTEALLVDIAEYYRTGVPNERVTKTVSREWVIRLYREMFNVDNESQEDKLNRAVSNEHRLHQYLSNEAVRLFRRQLVQFLKDAREDLAPNDPGDEYTDERRALLAQIAARQRRALIHFCGWTLVSEDAVEDESQKKILRAVPEILGSYANDENEEPDVRAAAKLAAERIRRGCVDPLGNEAADFAALALRR